MKGISIYGCYAFILAFTVLSISGCEPEEEVVPAEPAPVVKFSAVEVSLRPYFQRFEDEAAKRGLDIDLTEAGITGAIVAIDEDHVAGQCSYGRGFNPNRVTVDEQFWNRATDRFKEFIVFHELGHCNLNRGHLETAFSNGVCASIMRSGTGDCFDNYNSQTREFYVDELFFPDQAAI